MDATPRRKFAEVKAGRWTRAKFPTDGDRFLTEGDRAKFGRDRNDATDDDGDRFHGRDRFHGEKKIPRTVDGATVFFFPKVDSRTTCEPVAGGRTKNGVAEPNRETIAGGSRRREPNCDANAVGVLGFLEPRALIPCGTEEERKTKRGSSIKLVREST